MGGGMRIHTVRIRNLRCFAGGDDKNWNYIFSPNQNLSLLIGPNGAGKTSLLDAIDLTLNAEGRSNRSLISEYDFPNCDTSRQLSIEVVLTDLGNALGAFESDIQWIDPADGIPVEAKNIEVDHDLHIRAVIIGFEAGLDAHTGEIEWRWLLPKFQQTSMLEAKELSASQHKALGYFRINPAISAGAFSLGQYSTLGRHLRKLKYRLGKLPESIRGQTTLPTCSLEKLECETCPSRPDCIPVTDDPAKDLTIAGILTQIVAVARKVLGSQGWNDMQAGFGPRFGGLTSALSGITIGLKTSSDKNAFIPFDQLSSGEKYALSFALARIRAPGEVPPVIVMEEPETALYPSAVATLLREIQAIPTGNAPQVIISSHSESVLRCFSPNDVFILGGIGGSAKLQEAIDSIRPEKGGPFYRPEYLVMPGGPSALFADKVLVVEGPGDVVAFGRLDRIAARNAADNKGEHLSFSARGWCVFQAQKADQIHDTVKVLESLGKEVAALFDGDEAKDRHAPRTKDLCPTFVYTSASHSNPELEEVLIFGLPQSERDLVMAKFLDHVECSSCERRDKRCWKRKNQGISCPKGDKDERKTHIRNLCLDRYEEQRLFPGALRLLLDNIESAKPGRLHKLPIDG
jgi:ABC-type arginine transport system ATPase subunit